VAVANGADKPSEYQIKNGMDSTGSAAIASGNVPIETANTEVPAVITLPADAAEYDIYVVLYKAYNASYIVDIWSEVVGLDVTTPLPALAAPTDLAWDDTTPGTIKAKWDTVPNALRYYVYLYKDGHICLETLETTNERNFISNLEVYGTGTYTFKVEAVGDGTNYGNSQKSAVSPGYNYTAAPDKIDIPAISGVTAPVKGAAPVTAITENEQFTGTVTWAPAITGGKFAAGTVYTATITLTPKTGYTLTGVPADFFTVEGADTVSNDADSDIVTAVFPKTAAASSGGRGGSVTPSVTGVAIKSAPDKVAYTEGDELDLSGLLLTLTYSNGTTKDIALADFADNKITVSPKAGDVLDVDDKEIVITVKGKTVKLPITVEEDTTVIPPPAEEPVLTDIDGHWAKDSIEHLIEMGAISGYPDNTFRPDNPITRAEFATVLVKAMGLPVAGSKVFADTESHWAKEAISTAYAAGIISGYNEQSFGPDDLITREQMAVMVAKAAGLTGAAPELEYTDSQQISAWAREFVARAAAEKLISGYPDNTFRPADNATRAEAVTVISRKW